VFVETSRGIRYRLDAPWTVDSLGNIVCTGNIVKETQTLSRVITTYVPFEGTIPTDEIESVKEEKFDGGKTVLLIFGVIAIVGVIGAATLEVKPLGD